MQGLFRRLLHRSLHRRQLPRDNKSPQCSILRLKVKQAVACVKQTIELLLSIKGKRTVDSFHASWARSCGTSVECRAPRKGLQFAIGQIRALQEEYWKNVNVPGSGEDLNQSLEKAGRVADFFELAELCASTPSTANESCGGHFREEIRRLKARLSVMMSITPTSRPGLSRPRQPAHADQGALGIPLRSPQPEELQVNEANAKDLAPEES